MAVAFYSFIFLLKYYLNQIVLQSVAYNRLYCQYQLVSANCRRCLSSISSVVYSGLVQFTVLSEYSSSLALSISDGVVVHFGEPAQRVWILVVCRISEPSKITK